MPDPRNPGNPLTDDMIARIRRDRATLNQTQQDIQRACQCGIDMRGDQALCDALCERLDALLHHYAGGGKSR